ncbi:MAG: serpin family protein [bacterium]|nr:serpin family protein [bacterium]
MSSTASMYTVTSAFVAAEKAFLGENRQWRTKNEMQKVFVRTVLGPCRPELANIPELVSMAALSEEPINAFLRQKGFDIQLDKFPSLMPPKRAWGAASVLDVLLKWRTEGTRTQITTPIMDKFPAANLPKSTTSVFMSKLHPHPVASVFTKSGDVVHMTVCDKDLQHFSLLEEAEAISLNEQDYAPYEGVIFPMVDLNHKVDISWLKELSTLDDEGYPNVLTQALQQTKFKMNHEGARIKDAVAIGGMRLTAAINKPLPPLIIDRPFLFWVERPNLSRPLFVARFTEEDWKDPGSLQM